MSRHFPLIPAIIALLMAAPVEASTGAVPEPSNLALFLLGLLGVIIGRQSIAGSRDRHRED
jgi:xanthosine utilization system XapX-like protein